MPARSNEVRLYLIIAYIRLNFTEAQVELVIHDNYVHGGVPPDFSVKEPMKHPRRDKINDGIV